MRHVSRTSQIQWNRLGAIAIVFVSMFPTPALAQEDITATIVARDYNFSLAGVFMGSVLSIPDVYAMYMTNGLRRFTWDDDARLQDTVTDGTCNEHPLLSADPACGDQIGLFWKHISCNSWYVPCEDNDRWNAGGRPGDSDINNASTFPHPGEWPIPRFSHLINSGDVNYRIPDPPRTNNEAACHPGNPSSHVTGVTAPKVVRSPSSGHYFMAFSGNINHPDPISGRWTGDDNWRILWAVSTDEGRSWTIHPGVLFMWTGEEQRCGDGLMVDDLILDNGNFYLIATAVNGRTVHLWRAPLDEDLDYGFDPDSWRYATTPDATGHYTWEPVPLGIKVDYASVAYDLMPDTYSRGPNAGFYQKQVAVTRVFRSEAPRSTSYFIGFTSVGAAPYPIADPEIHKLELWATTSMDKKFTLQSRFSPGLQNEPLLVPSSYGWFVTTTRYPDNTAMSPRVLGTGFDLWLTGQEEGCGDICRQITWKTTVRLDGDIYAFEKPEPFVPQR